MNSRHLPIIFMALSQCASSTSQDEDLSSHQSPLTSLPNEIVVNIASYLRGSDMQAFMLTIHAHLECALTWKPRPVKTLNYEVSDMLGMDEGEDDFVAPIRAEIEAGYNIILNIKNSGLKFFGDLAENKHHISSLHLISARVEGHVLQNLSYAKLLNSLVIENCDFDPGCLSAWIKTLPNLRALSVHVDFTCCSELPHLLPSLQQLETLTVTGDLFMDEELWESVFKLSSLKSLTLAKSYGVKAQVIRGLIQLVHLEHFKLYKAWDVNDEIKDVWTDLPHLKHLDLSETSISDETLEVLENHVALLSLRLSNTKMPSVQTSLAGEQKFITSRPDIKFEGKFLMHK